MPLTYSRWLWGFEIFDSGPNQNNILEYTYGGSQMATLYAGVYTVDEFEAEVVRAFGAVTNGGALPGAAVTFDMVGTLKFTISSTASFTLNSTTGQDKAKGPWLLLGFDTGAAGDPPAGMSATSDVAAGTGVSAAKAWTAAEPLAATTPATAQPNGAAALLTNRATNTIQHVSDGATVESIYIATMRLVRIAFRCLTSAEQAHMEEFLNWSIQGKRLTWQPDSTSSNFMKVVLANPGQINNTFEWLTRSETSYGVLTFLEQMS